MVVAKLRSRTARECSPNRVVDPTQGWNTSGRPIADKYREGKMKRTPGGESKVPEIVGREALGDDGQTHASPCCPVREEKKKKEEGKGATLFLSFFFFFPLEQSRFFHTL